MRILYTYEYDFLDPHRQSGRPWQVRQALAQRGHDIVDLPNVLAMGPDHRLAAQAFWRMRGRIQRRDREPRRLTLAAGRVQKAFAAEKCDIVVAPSTIPLAYASPGLPAIEVLDAFFRYNLDRYDSFSNVTARYREEGLACDDLALSKSSGMVVPTADLARAMIASGFIPSERVKVCPWGPNLTPAHDVLDAEALRRRFDAQTVLFVGREWRRKGFDVVLDAMRSAEGRQLKCVALGLGAKDVPPRLLEGVRERVTFLGELSLSLPGEHERARRAFAEATLLMVPTRAENFGITFVEALSFGLPVVTFDTDGLSSVLGRMPCATLLPSGSPAEAFAHAAAETTASAGHYHELCVAAVQASVRFSWTAVAEAIETLVELGPRCRAD